MQNVQATPALGKRQPLRVAVIADTHGRFPEALRERLAGYDEIWHLGDVCDLATLEAVRAAGPPVLVVAGNNDYALDLPPRLLVERFGRSFLLMHLPPRFVGGTDYLLHGHTHLPRDEQIGVTRVLNPGTVGKPDKGAPAAWASLAIGEAGVVWELQPLAGAPAAIGGG